MAGDIPVLKPIIVGPANGATLFFIQGWPDDITLWNDLVAALRDRYRCVRVNLPNYQGAEYQRWGYSHDEIVEALARCVREVSPSGPVTVICHDWGAIWGYRLHHLHPELVARIVGMDVAPHMKPTPREISLIVAYQWWLIAAFVSGGFVGDWMTRRLARSFRSPRQGAALDSRINYPYLYTWRDIFTGRFAKNFKGYRPQIPIMFIYGERKPARFHSDRWLESVRSRPENQVVALPDFGHWVQKDPKLTRLIRDWLDRTA